MTAAAITSGEAHDGKQLKDLIEKSEQAEFGGAPRETEERGAKNNYGYGRASGCGKVGITIQVATTLFLVNMKRIFKLEAENEKEN